MQLTSLEIYGFKSFADRTKFVFDKGITGIVGPNGCGKSNVVDSIRWVLGEQRTKNLRSDKMENIIFNGTKDRRKANFAEVSLTFENTRNLLPTEYSVITVTRKLYRSGESEYLINGVQCRLKDIQDLFLDTGISADSYAIIELKMVDEMLTNKDNERRHFFEEAAGISKYKIRKKQTLKRLEETVTDLERVEDLLFEIDKNLKSLEKQARRTQRYFELKEKYRQISSQYAFLMVRSIREKQRQVEILTQNIQDQITASQSALAQREARIADLRKTQTDQEKALSEAQADLNRHLRGIQSAETEKSIKNERLKYLQQREVSIRHQLKTEQEQAERHRQTIGQLQTQLADLSGTLDAQVTTEATLQREREHLRRTHEEEQRQSATMRAAHREAEQELQQLTREKEIKSVQIRSLESERQRAEEDRYRRAQDLDAFAEKARELETEATRLRQELRQLQERQVAHRTRIEETEQQINSLKDAVYKTNRLRDARQNEHGLTKSLVENLEGFPASVKFLKKNARWIKDAPLLSDVFTVPEAYKVAFENFLEPYLSYYVVPTRKDAVLAVHLLAEAAKGRANFFILEELDHYAPATPLLFTQAERALDVVETAPEYRKLSAFLLDRLYLVPDEKDLPEQLPGEVAFMTRAGNMLQGRFVLGGGSLGLFEGKRLGRARNLEKLEKEIAKLETQLAGEKLELEKAQRLYEELKRIDYSRDIEALMRQTTEKERDLQVLQSREKEHREFLQRVGQRSEDLETEIENLRTALAQIDPALRQQLETLQQLNGRLAQAQARTQETAERLDEASHTYNEAHIRLIHLRNQDENLRRELDQKTETILRLEDSTDKLGDELEQVQADTERIIQTNMQEDEGIVRLYQQKKEGEARVGRMEQQLANTKNSIRQVEESVSEERHRRDELVRKQAELKENNAEIRVELNALRERMSVEFQIDINELQAEALFDRPAGDYDLRSVEEDLLRLRQQVQNFGEINPLALEAFQEMKERFDFITAQKQDLLDARQSLLDTIAEIDETAKTKFLETFGRVREHFQQVFRSLFSEDDKCDLHLLDENDPLESDINIIARPKGKRPLTIKQLSGGEKTLTAVALLFAIYLIKPAPFCIFDEVDAPLDDANIDKFNNIIRDFSGTSQFIIVTHNKRTMATTNVMYGVTMQQAGVSSILPVNLETMPVG
ncbi:MAG: chromosome segregation protein SMC [Bacteroidia bacterium]